MLSMFCKCNKEKEFQSIINHLEFLQGQNRKLHESTERLQREVSQLTLMIRDMHNEPPKKTKGKNG